MRNADCHDDWNGPEMRDEADACLISVDECYLAHGKSPSNTLYRVLRTSSNNAVMFIQLVDSQRVVSAPYGTRSNRTQASAPGQRQPNCLLYPRNMVDLK